MHTYVWVDAWQQQCCGPDFRVGSTVTWEVVRTDGQDQWVTTLLGPDWGDAVRYAEDHHGMATDAPLELRGVVRAIHVVTCDRVLGDPPPTGGPRGRVWMPVPGSGRLRAVTAADPWEPERDVDSPERSFDGWIVELETDRDPAG